LFRSKAHLQVTNDHYTNAIASPINLSGAESDALSGDDERLRGLGRTFPRA
jgi:hypothetical protein